MLIARLLLAVGGVVAIAALILYLATGNRAYLRIISRALLVGLVLLLVLGIGLLVGRLFGILL